MTMHHNNRLVEELTKSGKRNPEIMRLMAMITTIAGEVFVLKAQVERLKRALEATGCVDEVKLAKAAAEEGMTRWLASEEAEFARNVAAAYLEGDVTLTSTSWMMER